MQIAKKIKKIEESKIWYTNFSWNIWFKLSSLNYIFLLSYQYILFHSSELKTEKHMYLLLYWNFFKMSLILAIKRRQTQFCFFKLDFFLLFLAHYVGLCVFTAESLVCYNMCGYKSRCLCFPYINHIPIALGNLKVFDKA